MTRFVWFEYMAGDLKAAQGFFGELFNWSTKDVPMAGTTYAMISSGGETIGGYRSSEGGPATWLSHLLVTDAKASAAKVTKLGGKVVKEPFAVGTVGHMAIVLDPHGGALALWQATQFETPKPPSNGSFIWNELSSTDPAASVTFYCGLGGFEDAPMEMPGMGTYHVLKSGGESRAGIMAKMMPQQPHAWLPYVQVASADATADKAAKLGATGIVPPTDIPGVGRFAIFADPQGGTLGVLQP